MNRLKFILLIVLILILVFSIIGCQKTVYHVEIDGTAYIASKIIEYNDTSIRFIDKNGNERFISGAKRIDVKEIKY